VFFVISGYLITGMVHEAAAEGRFSFARFYERRARRLFPAAALVALLAARARRAFWWIALGLGCVSFGASLWVMREDTPAAFFLMPLRAWEFCLGTGRAGPTPSLSSYKHRSPTRASVP
jgi:peptidoglycan/LPS O-acetylase OafA/YrhL